ncbi:DNA mismatch repair protein MutS [Atopobacter phocae]|uniref:DNA mismatch repair protein MutS n=1 Tax=Atopobacter phocae TaxID=136492 RepID=UPI0004713504|nr:DNA mismatch repair protein MutS [Atopobacter phocae]
MSKTTPMMQQYQEIKSQYPDAFLFYRLGDFYELFNEDAIKASQILEITLTSRNKNAENPIPMSGVPHHSAKEYIKTLIDKGYKVAICEQMEDPKLTKGMVKREVVQVITPGTYLEDDDHRQLTNRYLVSLVKVKDDYGISAVDLGTGEWIATEVSLSNLSTEIASLHPTEILVVDPLILDSIDEPLWRDVLVSTVEISDQLPMLTIANGQTIPESSRYSAKVIMSYLMQTQKKQMTHLKPIEYYKPNHAMYLSLEAREHLELMQNYQRKSKKGSLLNVLDRTQTAMGSRLLKKWIEKPLINVHEISRRQNGIQMFVDHYFELMEIKEYLERVYDLERLVTRLSLGSIRPRDLKQLERSLKNLPSLFETIKMIDGDALWLEKIDEIMSVLVLGDWIEEIIVEDPPLTFKDGGVIRDGANEELDRYRDIILHSKEWLLQIQERERQKSGAKTLKIGFNKVFGYYIEITKAQLNHADVTGYERKQTLTNAERFITEELKELETDILNAEAEIERLELKIYEKLRQKLLPYQEQLQKLAQLVAEIDVIQGFSQIAQTNQYARPIINEKDRSIHLKNARHPVVEEVLEAGKFVPNDIILSDAQRIQMITGPNMAGKSTYMRQVALIILMTQIGSFVPCESATLPIFTKLFTRIGASDDLSTGKSTFMVEMMETKEALINADRYSLILFDEIGRGTATYDGMALAQSIIEYLAKEIPAVVLFSTHYHELTNLSDEYAGIQNVHMEALEENGHLSFSHVVKEGSADKSYGIHVAKLAGMPNQVVERAHNLLRIFEDKELPRLENIRNNNHASVITTDSTLLKRHDELKNKILAINLYAQSPLDVLKQLEELQKELNMNEQN